MEKNLNKIERGDGHLSADRVMEMLKNLKVDPEDVEEVGHVEAWRKASQKILGNPNLDSETLDELVPKIIPIDVGSGGKGAEIIRNPNVSEETVFKMAKDEDLGVRARVAIVENKNPKATSETIRVLAKKADYTFLADLGRHPNTHPEILEDLMREFRGPGEGLLLRIGVGESPNLTPELYEDLAEDESWAVRSNIAGHADAPSHIRANLAKDDHWFVRARTAESEKSPEVLMELANDENEYVRSAVLKNQNTPPELKEELEGVENPKKMKKEVRMVLEEVLKKSDTMQEPLFNYFYSLYSKFPLINDTAHYGRMPPEDRSKSLTSVLDGVFEEMGKVSPVILDKRARTAFINLDLLTDIIEATLGIGSVPDVYIGNSDGGAFLDRK